MSQSHLLVALPTFHFGCLLRRSPPLRAMSGPSPTTPTSLPEVCNPRRYRYRIQHCVPGVLVDLQLAARSNKRVEAPANDPPGPMLLCTRRLRPNLKPGLSSTLSSKDGALPQDLTIRTLINPELTSWSLGLMGHPGN